MRSLRILLAIVAVGVALLVAPWALVPIAVGLVGGAVVFFELSKRPWMQKVVRYFKTAAVVVALAVTTWFVIGTPLKPEQGSIGSRVNQAVRGVVQDTSFAPRLAQSQADLDRLNLREALQNERRKLALISKALYLNEAASKTRMRQTTIGGADEKLSGALDKFQELFGKERTGADGKQARLLAPAALAAHVRQAAAAIDKLEKEGQSGNKSSQQLRDFRLGIANAMVQFEVETLFGAVGALQDQLKTALNLQLATEQSYTARYDRASDSLVLEQAATLRLADNPASEIDLTGFFSVTDGRLGADLDEEITVQADSRPAEKADPAAPLYKLPAGLRDLVVVKRVTRRNAAESLSRGLLPLQFTQVRVEWLLPRDQGVTLTLRPGNTGEEWPFVVPLKYADDAKLTRIMMPRHSVHYVHPSMDSKLGALFDELAPGDAGRLRSLPPGSVNAIRVELLPGFLSNDLGQKIKPYLVVENLIAAAFFAAITMWGVGALKP